jgi:hypothetical protein
MKHEEFLNDSFVTVVFSYIWIMSEKFNNTGKR